MARDNFWSRLRHVGWRLGLCRLQALGEGGAVARAERQAERGPSPGPEGDHSRVAEAGRLKVQAIAQLRRTPTPVPNLPTRAQAGERAERRLRLIAGGGALWLAFWLSIAATQACGQVAAVTPVLGGALKALDALCEVRKSPYLELARDYLERGDLTAAQAYLRTHLAERGADKAVSGLLALLESEAERLTLDPYAAPVPAPVLD